MGLYNYRENIFLLRSRRPAENCELRLRLPKICSAPPAPQHAPIAQHAGLGIRSFAHRSFAHFAQIKWATVSDSLRSLKTNERPWANRSGRSEEMSDRERIAQVAQDKWATMSDSLRSLRGNERMSDSLKKIWLKKSKILFYYVLLKV